MTIPKRDPLRRSSAPDVVARAPRPEGRAKSAPKALWRLYLEDEGGETELTPLTGVSYVLGSDRGAGADVVLAGPGVSPRHALLWWGGTPAGWWLRNEASLGGTRHCGLPVTADVRLTPNDIIELGGSVRLRVGAGGEAPVAAGPFVVRAGRGPGAMPGREGPPLATTEPELPSISPSLGAEDDATDTEVMAPAPGATIGPRPDATRAGAGATDGAKAAPRPWWWRPTAWRPRSWVSVEAALGRVFGREGTGELMYLAALALLLLLGGLGARALLGDGRSAPGRPAAATRAAPLAPAPAPSAAAPRPPAPLEAVPRPPVPLEAAPAADAQGAPAPAAPGSAVRAVVRGPASGGMARPTPNAARAGAPKTPRAAPAEAPPAPAAPGAEGAAGPGGEGDDDGAQAAARKRLEGKANAGQASSDELQRLQSLCRRERDLACVERARALAGGAP
jgi:hypothetical protein